MPVVVPYSHRYDGRCLRRTWETFAFFRRYFDTVAAGEIVWQPWALMPAEVKDQYAGAQEASYFRLLLEGPVCRAWFLDERFMRQTMGLPEPVVPMPLSASMRATKSFSFSEMI